MNCVKVLIAGSELVTEAVAPSKKSLVERLPDAQVLAGGGLEVV